MRRLLMLCVLALMPLLVMLVLPAPSQAQEPAGSTDFRGRGGYSAEDLAQALFPPETSSLHTRSIGPAPGRPSLPVPRAAVTLNVLFGSNAEAIPSTSYAEVDQLGTILSWPQYADYLIQLEGHKTARALNARIKRSQKSVSRIGEGFGRCGSSLG